MDIVNSFKRRIGHKFAVFASLLALVLATIVPGLASAAQLTARSIALSSSSKAATAVTYTVGFTAIGAAGAVRVDFCSNSPLASDACTAAAGFTAASAASTTSGVTAVAGAATNVVATDPITAGAVSIVLTGIDNPTAAGPLYARIITFDTAAHASAFVPGTTAVDSTAGVVDYGGAAISITDSVGVSAAVQESMIFCVSKTTITADCGSTTAPTVALGETVGSSVALVPTAVSTGSIYTQISTNASGGAVVNLKSNATGCGGLIRAGAPGSCDIGPALNAGITQGQAKFGVLATPATDTGTSPSGTFETKPSTFYNGTTYAMNYVAGDATGVTSTYGDPFLDTAGAPANNKNMQLTFGASVTNSTPAGNYSADLSLIATGTF